MSEGIHSRGASRGDDRPYIPIGKSSAQLKLSAEVHEFVEQCRQYREALASGALPASAKPPGWTAQVPQLPAGA
jgi:hypothetical protein